MCCYDCSFSISLFENSKQTVRSLHGCISESKKLLFWAIIPSQKRISFASKPDQATPHHTLFVVWMSSSCVNPELYDPSSVRYPLGFLLLPRKTLNCVTRSVHAVRRMWLPLWPPWNVRIRVYLNLKRSKTSWATFVWSRRHTLAVCPSTSNPPPNWSRLPPRMSTRSMASRPKYPFSSSLTKDPLRCEPRVQRWPVRGAREAG